MYPHYLAISGDYPLPVPVVDSIENKLPVLKIIVMTLNNHVDNGIYLEPSGFKLIEIERKKVTQKGGLRNKLIYVPICVSLYVLEHACGSGADHANSVSSGFEI